MDNTQENGRPYGGFIPKKGCELLVRLLAASAPLVITRIMMGQGLCPEDTFPGELEDLVEPVAAGTSSQPAYDGDTLRMTVEYRSDLNGGLDRGFWIREFGVFAKDLEGAEVLLYYGTLGDYPQWVSAYSSAGVDVRRYPISIQIGTVPSAVIDYSPEAFLTSEDVMQLCTSTVLPAFLTAAQELIDAHSADPDAHPSIRAVQAALDARLSLLELMYTTDVSGNPFTVTFDSLSGLSVSGVHNTAQKRIEF